MDITIVVLRTFETAEVMVCGLVLGLFEDDPGKALAEVLKAYGVG
ncbi:MAG: hypothetical protein ABSC91_03480 [Candidatus Bathyarchaeia archaeon]|jgi:hypothetical protein